MVQPQTLGWSVAYWPFSNGDKPWVAFVWCFPHRLELALKDALPCEFELVEESLRHLFTCTKIAQRKSANLFLKSCSKPYRIYTYLSTTRSDQPNQGVLDGLTTNYEPAHWLLQHIENIIADTSKKASDRDALTGKVRKLKCASLLLRSALFIDLLDSARKFSVISQKAEVNILLMIDTLDDPILHYQMLLMKLKKDPAVVFELPTLK